MRKSTIITWNGREVTVKELTPRELDRIMQQADGPASMLDRILDAHYLSAAIIAAATEVPEEELETSAPSALAPLIEATKEVNPDFLAAISRAVKGRG
jgi:hypothetical protein